MKDYPQKLFYVFFPLLLILFSYKLAVLTMDYSPNQQTTLNFLQGKGNLNENFTEKEISHLEDVKQVIVMMEAVFYLSLLISTLTLTRYRRNKEKIKSLFRKTGIITASVTTFLALIGVISFNFLFTLFHKIFFPQGNWQFPANSMLIQTFPLDFFISISSRIFIFSLFFGIIFILISYLFLNDSKSKRN